ncbi:hypothetical protein [Paractinoplanes rishiriensis]|uniref:hypothetical protein n=1 Tax=Paractinoplanes rishiriensis TaxID=1050105 RepID=UPI001941D4DE|nr:hypothetical protein [Actinoplanes rishiriensis]
MADAPVDGTAALDVQVAAAEPVRLTGGVGNGPRLRVAPPAPISAPRAPFVASVIGVVVVGVLGILLINTKTNENSFKIADMQKQGAALANQRQDLENQLVEASSIGNLDAAARRLGLVKAESPALFRLPDGKIIGVLTPTNGRPAVTAQDAKGNKTGGQDAGRQTENGAATNGGQATGGQTTNGQTTNGQGTNGQATNGSQAGVDGAVTGGAATGQVSGNGVAGNGVAGNGVAGNGVADGTQGGSVPAGTGQ